MNQIRRMGDIKSLMNMIPGMSKMLKDVDISDKDLRKVEAIIFSMTPDERKNPDLINLSRKKRISRGCGRTMEDLNNFIKQFNQMRDLMHKVSNGGFPGMPGMGAPKGGFRRK
jgi:signal recognition particle subunit SRP54